MIRRLRKYGKHMKISGVWCRIGEKVILAADGSLGPDREPSSMVNLTGLLDFILFLALNEDVPNLWQGCRDFAPSAPSITRYGYGVHTH